MPRFFCPGVLTTGTLLDLPAGAARHVQVLRLQPGAAITLFQGGVMAPHGQAPECTGEFAATVTQMGRTNVQVQVGDYVPTQREPARRVHLAVGMPTNERMDWLVEKATELGVASIQPLMTERSVLRLSGERADKKVAHWHSVAIAACEQCGGNQVPVIHEVMQLMRWLKGYPGFGANQELGLLLSVRTDALNLRVVAAAQQQPDNTGAGAQEVWPFARQVTVLSGPEGGLGRTEEDAALIKGFKRVTLGPRVLRAETAALAALAALLL